MYNADMTRFAALLFMLIFGFSPIVLATTFQVNKGEAPTQVQGFRFDRCNKGKVSVETTVLQAKTPDRYSSICKTGTTLKSDAPMYSDQDVITMGPYQIRGNADVIKAAAPALKSLTDEPDSFTASMVEIGHIGGKTRLTIFKGEPGSQPPQILTFDQ